MQDSNPLFRTCLDLFYLPHYPKLLTYRLWGLEGGWLNAEDSGRHIHSGGHLHTSNSPFSPKAFERALGSPDLKLHSFIITSFTFQKG